jgi:hypothetical protein
MSKNLSKNPLIVEYSETLKSFLLQKHEIVSHVEKIHKCLRQLVDVSLSIPRY